MLPHRRELTLREGRRLAQYRFGDADLADVVEQPRQPDGLERVVVHPELAPDGQRCGGHALRVSMGVAVLGVDGGDHGLNRVEEKPLERRHQPRAIDGGAGLVADEGEELEVALAERQTPPPIVGVEDADRLVARGDRRAEDGLNIEQRHAVGIQKPHIGARVLADDGHAVLEHVLHDGAADRGVVAPGCRVAPPGRNRVGDARGVTVGFQQQRDPVRVDRLEDRTDDLVEYRLAGITVLRRCPPHFHSLSAHALVHNDVADWIAHVGRALCAQRHT